jgi:hypothetical protein
MPPQKRSQRSKQSVWRNLSFYLTAWQKRYVCNLIGRGGIMFDFNRLCQILLSIMLAMVIILSFTDDACSKEKSKKKKEESYVMTEAELQAHLMGFADRFAAYISQSFEAYDELAPPLESRRIVLRDAVYSMYSAYTIAADADPDAALLDMVVMVTLGRLIYEGHWLVKLKPSIKSMVAGFRKAEGDIWDIVAMVLKPDQQQKLLGLIKKWRRNHPKELQFSYLRVSDYAAERAKSKLARIWKPSGIFKSVEMATQQVEEARLLAERAMFLVTRAPLLTGYFADVWTSQLLISPELKELLSDLHRFVDVTEKLPQNFTREQKTLVKQAMDRLAKERKNTIDDFLAQEARLKGVLTDIKQAATETNKLMISLNSFTDKFESEPQEDSQPFNINDYKETAAEIAAAGAQLNSLLESLDRLLNSPGMERLLPQIEDAITIAGEEGEELIDHSFRQAALLLLIWFVVYIIARLLVSYFSKKIPNFSG